MFGLMLRRVSGDENTSYAVVVPVGFAWCVDRVTSSVLNRLNVAVYTVELDCTVTHRT